MFNILITDDEKSSREFIRALVEEVEPVATIFEARSANEAKAILDTEEIDFLFCDIKMPHQTGFDLLHTITERNFSLVFVTAYKEYAIQAIKEGAADYILKPIDPEEFKSTFKKLIEKHRAASENKHHAAKGGSNANNKLILSHSKGVTYISLPDIVYMQADNVYTTLFLVNGEKITSSKAIHRFEEILASQGFYRIHKSYLLNLSHFKEYISKGNLAKVSGGDLLQISRLRLADFLDLVEQQAGRFKA